MAEYEKKHGDFVLFAAKNRKSDKSPSHTGTIFLDGKTYNIAAWEKHSQTGNKFFSGRVGDEYNPGERRAPTGGGYQSQSSYQKTASKHSTDLDDEIPF